MPIQMLTNRSAQDFFTPTFASAPQTNSQTANLDTFVQDGSCPIYRAETSPNKLPACRQGRGNYRFDTGRPFLAAGIFAAATADDDNSTARTLGWIISGLASLTIAGLVIKTILEKRAAKTDSTGQRNEMPTVGPVARRLHDEVKIYLASLTGDPDYLYIRDKLPSSALEADGTLRTFATIDEARAAFKRELNDNRGARGGLHGSIMHSAAEIQYAHGVEAVAIELFLFKEYPRTFEITVTGETFEISPPQADSRKKYGALEVRYHFDRNGDFLRVLVVKKFSANASFFPPIGAFDRPFPIPEVVIEYKGPHGTPPTGKTSSGQVPDALLDQLFKELFTREGMKAEDLAKKFREAPEFADVTAEDMKGVLDGTNTELRKRIARGLNEAKFPGMDFSGIDWLGKEEPAADETGIAPQMTELVGAHVKEGGIKFADALPTAFLDEKGSIRTFVTASEIEVELVKTFGVGARLDPDFDAGGSTHGDILYGRDPVYSASKATTEMGDTLVTITSNRFFDPDGHIVDDPIRGDRYRIWELEYYFRNTGGIEGLRFTVSTVEVMSDPSPQPTWMPPVFPIAEELVFSAGLPSRPYDVESMVNALIEEYPWLDTRRIRSEVVAVLRRLDVIEAGKIETGKRPGTSSVSPIEFVREQLDLPEPKNLLEVFANLTRDHRLRRRRGAKAVPPPENSAGHAKGAGTLPEGVPVKTAPLVSSRVIERFRDYISDGVEKFRAGDYTYAFGAFATLANHVSEEPEFKNETPAAKALKWLKAAAHEAAGDMAELMRRYDARVSHHQSARSILEGIDTKAAEAVTARMQEVVGPNGRQIVEDFWREVPPEEGLFRNPLAALDGGTITPAEMARPAVDVSAPEVGAVRAEAQTKELLRTRREILDARRKALETARKGRDK